jgi:hypothetical protein
LPPPLPCRAPQMAEEAIDGNGGGAFQRTAPPVWGCLVMI